MKTGSPSEVERRKTRRHRDNIFIFANVMSSPGEEFKAIAKDISAGGLMFETERNVSKKSVLELEIYQPIDCCKKTFFSVAALAKPIWIKKIEKNSFEEGENKHRVGIKFSGLKKEDRQRIAKYVDDNVKMDG